MKRLCCIALILTVGILAGCNKSTDEPAPSGDGATAQAATGTPAVAPVDIPETTDPRAAITLFLESLRNGDEQTAQSLLTTTVRQNTANSEMALSTLSGEQTNFDVGDVQYVGDDQNGAHVMSAWSEIDEFGNVQTHEVVWILRRETTAQWRVAGMAFKPFEDSPEPLVLNFEDPEQMQEQIKQANAEYQRRAAADLQQAQLPADQPTTR